MTVPTQAEIEAISRELTDGGVGAQMRPDLHQRAALMIARLERAWIEAQSGAENPGANG
jgi:hypothetical protein